MNLEEVVCATLVFKRMKGHKGAQVFAVEDTIRPDVYCVSISRGPREFILNNRSCTFEDFRGTFEVSESYKFLLTLNPIPTRLASLLCFVPLFLGIGEVKKCLARF